MIHTDACSPTHIESARIPFELPPLILHPFDDRSNPVEPGQSLRFNPLTRQYLEARYSEFRMLCLIGKDLNRWLGQCVDVASRDAELACMTEGDFIAVLLFAPPTSVLRKLRSWGIRNFQIIFSRAIGLNAVFPHPPSDRDLSEAFLRSFHRYADALYDSRLKAEDLAPGYEDKFAFEIYASAEYSSYLEKTWDA